MRILAVTNMYPSPHFPSRGVFVQQQVEGLLTVGLNVRVLFIDRRQEGPAAYYRMRPRLMEAFAEFNPDLMHIMYGGVMADQITRRFKVLPTLVTFHGSDLLGENLSGWMRKFISQYGVWCSKRAARAADGIIVVARHLVNAMPRAVPRAKVRVVPCGIDLWRFRPLDPSACRQELGWSADAYHVLFASSNGDPVKRPWLAKAAIEEAVKRGLPAQIHCLTGVPNAEVPVWMSASDSLLLTSLTEGSPTVVKEALACGLPVVSVDVGDVAERIEGIEGCYLARPEPADLAAKLALVYQRRKRLDCRGHLEELSLLAVALRLKALYERVTCKQAAEAA